MYTYFSYFDVASPSAGLCTGALQACEDLRMSRVRLPVLVSMRAPDCSSGTSSVRSSLALRRTRSYQHLQNQAFPCRSRHTVCACVHHMQAERPPVQVSRGRSNRPSGDQSQAARCVTFEAVIESTGQTLCLGGPNSATLCCGSGDMDLGE